MSDIAIWAEHLSKQYKIGRAQKRHDTLRDALTDGVAGLFRRNGQAETREDTIWALDDLSFEVNRGDIVGVIGRNGAGKSTLLKILSRITKPTRGHAEIHGRVGSLLEVGTGFHPELTGRENIYLNGAILGMKRAEIDHKFDEIVAFAEVEKFIDTPVKRYSSGMYVRLAFAVAAHLEPEILMVDEVLAVGDAAFQKKCLGKMGDVAKEGRTVLFVSHNMQAIQSLCQFAFLMHAGQLALSGDAKSVISRYIFQDDQMRSSISWPVDFAPGNDEIKLVMIKVSTADNKIDGIFPSSEPICVEMRFIADSIHSSLCIGFDLLTSEGQVVARTYQTDQPPEYWPSPRLGENVWRCTIPGSVLNAGVYHVCPRIGLHNMYWIVNLDAVVKFEVILNHGVSPFWNVLDGRNRPGVIAPIFNWDAIG